MYLTRMEKLIIEPEFEHWMISSSRLLTKTLCLIVSSDFSDDADDEFDKKEKLRLIETPHIESLLSSVVLVPRNILLSFPASALHEAINISPESRGETMGVVAADGKLLFDEKTEGIR